MENKQLVDIIQNKIKTHEEAMEVDRDSIAASEAALKTKRDLEKAVKLLQLKGKQEFHRASIHTLKDLLKEINKNEVS